VSSPTSTPSNECQDQEIYSMKLQLQELTDQYAALNAKHLSLVGTVSDWASYTERVDDCVQASKIVIDNEILIPLDTLRDSHHSLSVMIQNGALLPERNAGTTPAPNPVPDPASNPPPHQLGKPPLGGLGGAWGKRSVSPTESMLSVSDESVGSTRAPSVADQQPVTREQMNDLLRAFGCQVAGDSASGSSPPLDLHPYPQSLPNQDQVPNVGIASADGKGLHPPGSQPQPLSSATPSPHGFTPLTPMFQKFPQGLSFPSDITEPGSPHAESPRKMDSRNFSALPQAHNNNTELKVSPAILNMVSLSPQRLHSPAPPPPPCTDRTD
jgi:hypothetical protein